MAEPRKVQFVTLSAFAAGAAAESRKRRLEDEGDFNLGRGGEVEAATGAGGGAGGDRSRAKAEKRATVRLSLTLSEPSDASSVEFNYGELIQNLQVESVGCIGVSAGRAAGVGVLRGCLCGLVMAERRVGDAPCLRWTDRFTSAAQRQQRSSRRCWPLRLQPSQAAMEPVSSPLPRPSALGRWPSGGGESGAPLLGAPGARIPGFLIGEMFVGTLRFCSLVFSF